MTSGDSLPSHHAKNKAASRRRNLALFVLGLVTLPSCQAMLLVYGIRIREYFAINAEQFGTLFGSRGLGRIPALLTIGPLLARMGVRRVTELATVGIGIGFLILGVGEPWRPSGCPCRSWAFFWDSPALPSPLS